MRTIQRSRLATDVSRFLLDTTVFLYAVGGRHDYKDPCRVLVESLRQDRVAGEVSVDLIHEFVHVRLRGEHDLAETITMANGIINSCEVHAFEFVDLSLALGLFAKYPRLDFRDAIFAATAINRGIEKIISTDRDFDEVPNLQRIDPADRDAVASLVGPV